MNAKSVVGSEESVFFMHAKHRLISWLARPVECAGCLFGSIYFIDRYVVSFRYVESGIADVKWFILMFYYVGTAIQRRKN